VNLVCVRCLFGKSAEQGFFHDEIPADVLPALTVWNGEALCLKHLDEAVKEWNKEVAKVRREDKSYRDWLGRSHDPSKVTSIERQPAKRPLW
jgi:hypothetical protein